MSELWASSPPTPGELAALREVIALTEPQMSATSALLATLNGRLENTAEEQRQLEAELATRRQSLLEWTQSRDLLSKVHLSLNSSAQSRPHVAHIRERAANPTATPSDDELAQRLVEEDNNDINAIRVSMSTRESTISILRSRIAVLEEDIAGCKRVSSHTKSMIALQASHKDQLQVLLAQHKLRLHPLMLLPDTCLEDIFLHVVQVSWEKWRRVFDTVAVPDDIRFTRYSIDPVLALTAVCHRWRTVATHLPGLWSMFFMFGSPTHAASRIAHYVRLAKDRALCILTIPSFLGEGDIKSFEIIKSSTVKVDALILCLFGSRYRIEQAMKVLPSPRVLVLRGFMEGFSRTPLPQELLSRTEGLCATNCLVTTEFTVPTLQSLELCLEDIKSLTPSITYIPSLLRNLPRLHSLSIQCQTAGNAPMDPQPASLLVSPGVCESVTHLEIPIMALCGPLKALRNVFTLPNLVRLSLLKFLQEGSDLQSWREFCLVNGGKINRLDLIANPAAFRKNTLSPEKLAFEFAQYLHHLPEVKYLSLRACLVHSLALALLADVSAKKGKGGDRLPNIKIFEICHVEESAVRPRFEEVLSSWNEARDIKEQNEATGQHGIATVLWT
jgi:hypothetical protein